MLGEAGVGREGGRGGVRGKWSDDEVVVGGALGRREIELGGGGGRRGGGGWGSGGGGSCFGEGVGGWRGNRGGGVCWGGRGAGDHSLEGTSAGTRKVKNRERPKNPCMSCR